MSLNFNQDSVWNLKPIPAAGAMKDVRGLLINGEEIVAAFKTIRDQLIFTNKRIISVDVQGFTGKKRSFSTLPYSKIQFFTVETPALWSFSRTMCWNLYLPTGQKPGLSFEEALTSANWHGQFQNMYSLEERRTKPQL